MGLLDAIQNFASTDEGLGLAQGLLSARGSAGLAAGLAGMQAAKENALKREFAQMQMQDMAAQAAQRNAIAKREQLAFEAMQRKAAALPSLFGEQSNLDWKTGLSAGYTPKELQELAGLRNIGREEVARTVEGKDAQGRPVVFQVDKFGAPIGGGIEQWKAPQSVQLGDRQMFIDPTTMQPQAAFAMGQSPDSKASNAVAWANNAIAREKLAIDKANQNQPQFHDGQWVYKPTAESPQGISSPVPGYSKPMGEAQKKQVTGIDALHSAIDEYKKDLGKFSAADLLRPDKRAEIGTKYNNMMLQAKEAYNLGVLNGPDYSILQSVVTDPASLRGALISNSALQKQASELDRLMAGTRAAVVNGGKTNPTASNIDDLLKKYGQ